MKRQDRFIRYRDEISRKYDLTKKKSKAALKHRMNPKEK